MTAHWPRLGSRDHVSPTVQDRTVDDVGEFAKVILVVCGGLSLAIGVRVVAGRLAIPTAGLLLVAAAVASDLVDRLTTILTFEDVQRVATLALIVILFEGGQKIGLRRFRRSAAPILALGVLGTFATAGLLTVAAHVLFDLSWTVSGLIGAALAPTDPAVTFSVLAGKEVEGRSGTILEGESGFNDPVGIALMIGMVELATSGGSFGSEVVGEFLVEMGVGLVVGIAGALAIVGPSPLRAAPRPHAVPARGDPRRRRRLRAGGRPPRLRLPRRVRRGDPRG